MARKHLFSNPNSNRIREPSPPINMTLCSKEKVIFLKIEKNLPLKIGLQRMTLDLSFVCGMTYLFSLLFSNEIS